MSGAAAAAASCAVTDFGSGPAARFLAIIASCRLRRGPGALTGR